MITGSPMRALQQLGNQVYRGFAGIVARILARSQIVRGIYLHRSVATGEAQFGRSDIDMVVVIRQPRGPDYDSAELLDLYRTVKRIRFSNPVLNHIELHHPEGLREWVETDPYRGSMERRGCLWLYGEPISLPIIPVTPEDCARRIAMWYRFFIPRALARRNRRNLEKFALETWNAFATATKLIDEPLLTRREMAQRCRETGDSDAVGQLSQDWRHSLRFILQISDRVYDRLLPPLGRLSRTWSQRILVPPAFEERHLVVLPSAESELPDEAFDDSAFVCTPKAFALYIHFANPFFYSQLPDELRGLEISPPAHRAYVRAVQHGLHSQIFRHPGFMNHDMSRPLYAIESTKHSIGHLEAGSVPPPIDRAVGQKWRQYHPTAEHYYADDYPRWYGKHLDLWLRVRALSQQAR
jgi:predicted nucleotidyltransferase